MIYLDNAATSFPKPPGMADAMHEHLASWCGNPGRSGHDISQKTAGAIAGTRELLAEFIGCSNPSRIIFTQNATSALNIAIHGILQKGDHVITTSMEHNSVLRPVIATGVEYTIVKCGSDGSLNPAAVEAAIRSNTRMIACTHASNVTGTIMPVNALVEICRKYNRMRRQEAAVPRLYSCIMPQHSASQEILLLIDASQTAGHIPVDIEGIDLLAAPGHKGLLGPMGTGFLYVSQGVELRPLMRGGTGTYSKLLEPPLEFPESFEAGTVNAPGIVGLGHSLKYLRKIYGDQDNWSPYMGDIHNVQFPSAGSQCRHLELIRFLDEALRNMDHVKVYGPSDCSRKVGIVTFNIDGWESRNVASLLNDNFGIATRAGFHCAGLAHKTIGTWDTGAVRMSLGLFNNMRQIRLAVDAVYEISKLKPGSRPPAPGPGCRR